MFSASRKLMVLGAATLICASVALLYVLQGPPLEVLMKGLGLPDFLLLTAIYSPLLAVSSVFLRLITAIRSRIMNISLALLFGSAFGLIWTYAAVWLFWTYVREIGLPMIAAWQCGGALGSLAAFVMLPAKANTDSNENPNHAHRPLRQMAPWIVSGVCLIGVLVCLTGANSYIYWSLLVEKEIYLIPNDYVGPILVVFNQPNGVPAKYEGRDSVYIISTSGVLFTQIAPAKNAYIAEFWYMDDAGSRKPLSYQRSCRETDLVGVHSIVVCPAGYQTSPPMDGYIVAVPNLQKEYHEVLDRRVETILAALQP